MYMRLPMIVGQAGLFATIGIIVIAHIISATTGLSVSSIATDKKVQAGGTYYMISRSLGLPIGGTLGLALFVGLSFSVSLYLIGFSESFLSYWGFEITKNAIRITGSAILLLVTIITFISTSLALKTQYFILAAIFLSLISILFGNHDFEPTAPLLSKPASTVPLMVLFGIFFPAVTGFEAGVSMSGDLKDPKKSIPMGSIAAILVGLVVYIFLAFFFAYNVDGEVLANDPKVLLKMAYIPELVLAGIWGATLSSALGSILGAPRILQATAVDKITPKIFAKGTGSTNEPRNALILTFLIAEGGILIGELDVIARVVSIFFITTYGFLNLSAAFERLTSADFRPSFKTPAWISLIGAAACFLVMIQLDFMAMIGASVILGFLYLFLKRKELVLHTGDAWGSIWASLVKTGLHRLTKDTNMQTRNWRPNILMFSGDEENRPYMIELGKDIAGRLGVLTGFELKPSGDNFLPRNKRITYADIKAEGLFMNIHNCKDVYSGMDEIVRVYGFGGVEPNTVLMGWSKRKNHEENFIEFIRRLSINNFNSLFIRYNQEKGFGNYESIDVWWSGWGNNLTFSITLLRHLTSSANWKDPKLRIFAITNESSMVEILYKSIEKILEEYRILMEIRVINNSVDKLPVHEIIWRESEKTDLTILGMSGKNIEQVKRSFNGTSKLLEKLGTTLIVSASTIFEDYNVVSEISLGKKMPSIMEELKLPELKTSPYNIINDAVKQLDSEGLKLQESFFEKTTSVHCTENELLASELKILVNGVIDNLGKIQEQSSKHNKIRQWAKSKNDFYFKSNYLINKYSNEKLSTLSDLLLSGISWYINEFEKVVQKSPKKITVPFSKEEFIVKPKDSLALRWLKLRKRMSHPFAGKSINLDINYRKIANFYLRDSRYKFLSEYLKKFHDYSLGFVAGIRDFVLHIENQLDVIQRDIHAEDYFSQSIEELERAFNLRLDELIANHRESSKLLQNRLLLEFRKNLQLFSNDLAKLNANYVIAKKRRKTNYYKAFKEQSLQFPESWHKHQQLYINLIRLDLQIFSLQFRLEEELNDFRQQYNQVIENGLLSKTRKFIELLKEQDGINNIPDLNIDGSFLQQNDFSELLQKSIDKIIESVPEKFEVADIQEMEQKKDFTEEIEVVEIPLRRVAKHFINFLLGSLIEVDLKGASEDLKKTIYRIKDHLSYMHFSLENVDNEQGIAIDEFKELLEETQAEITREEISVKMIRDELESNIRKNTKRAFEALSPHRISKSSRELSQTVRELKVSKSTGYFNEIVEDAKEKFKSLVLRVLYSRSEGVLLARELNESQIQRSLSEQLLDLLDEISPVHKVYETIPAYYKNLFSGRSSISEDFWIERPIEQSMYEKAWKHYRDGYQGAIMVLGERNSGKTAFCRYATKKYCTQNTVYHVFPPAYGSIEIKDFTKAINNVTNLRGSIEKVFEKLPYHSVMVFNDLELWWESSENGMKVIKALLDLIKTYSSKCFFIINMNKFTYLRIKELIEIDDYFISVIACQPFDSEELKDLIIRRHRSGGLKMHYGKIPEEKISEIRMAGIFNKYFNYSEGNPGLALFCWLASVNKQVGDKLYMKTPQKPNLSILKNLNSTWQVFLAQLLLHKRMDLQKLERVLQMEPFEIEKNINAMKMAGLVSEKTTGLYIINPVWDKFLSNYLQEGGFV